MQNLIIRQDAIEALWKALYEYEDKTEKQFIESDELDVEDWVQHRIFVHNMNDIDRQTILDLPSAQPKQSTEIQDILTYLDEELHPIVAPDNWNVYSELHDMISELSAQTERKKGKWILHENQRQEDVDNDNYLYVCSECGRSDIHAKTQEVPFCWWCGSEMREE